MEKKSKGKTVVIVILVLAVLGLGGYIVYDKFIEEKNTELNVKKEIKEEKDNVIDNKSNVNIIGYYKSGTLSIPKTDCDENNKTREIALLENGKFKSAYALGCGGADQSGTYTYANNVVTLVCDDNSSQCPEGTTIKYTVNEDGSLSGGAFPSEDSNTFVKFEKLSEQFLQFDSIK